MSLLQIQDNKNRAKKTAVGIDFGTTNCVISYIENNVAKVIHNNQNSNLFPSVLYFKKNGEINFTRDKNSKEEQIEIASIKRLICKGSKFINENKYLFNKTSNFICEQKGEIFLKIYDRYYSPLTLVSLVFVNLKKIASTFLGKEISQAVVTIPAYFNENAKRIILEATNAAKIEILRLITEPTAAAYAYSIHEKAKKEKHYLVYDFGGGTFDVSLIKMHFGVLKVVGVTGDNILGGDDIDYAIKELILKKCNINEESLELKKNLTKIAKDLKHNVFNKDNHQIFFKHKDKDYNIKLSSQDCKEQFIPIIEKTITITRKLLLEQEIEHLAGILLVGGSSRIPTVKDMLQKHFRNTKLFNHINPEKIVAQGAAYQANNLLNASNDLLIDVVPLSLGIELADGLVERIIDRNTALPIIMKKVFTTKTDNQNAVLFHIVQGEREFAKDCISLIKFELSNITVQQAGKIRVEVTFSLDINGILSVTTRDLASNAIKEVVINPKYQLDKNKISSHIKDAINKNKEDFLQKDLYTNLNAANELIKNVKKIFFSSKKETNNSNEKLVIDEIKSKITQLEKAILTKDINELKNSMHLLESFINPIIEEKISKSLKENILGKRIE